MKTVVCFRAGDGEYAVPVEQVREVRAGDTLMPLPDARDGVVGLLSVDGDALAVVDALGSGGSHVLLLDRAEGSFGLRVQEVTGVKTVDDIGPAPPGVNGDLIDGVFTLSDQMTMLVSVDKLGERLDR